ncbi:MAG: hypothetical protein C7N36_04470 [Bacteroidetes bacterium]|nr:MAG: hypothetical protein C7N36_04470 [Bacteroidota bacterium]
MGTGRSKFPDADFKKKLLEGVNKFSRKGEADQVNWSQFAAHISYHQADIKDDAAYQGLGAKITDIKKDWNQELTAKQADHQHPARDEHPPADAGQKTGIEDDPEYG